MKDFRLIHPQDTYVIPEYLFMETKEGSLVITFIEKYFHKIILFFEKNVINKDFQYYVPSVGNSWGCDNIFPPVTKTIDGYSFVIDIASQIDNEKRRSVSNSLSNFLMLMQIFSSKEMTEERDVLEGEQTQLFSLQTFYNPGGGFHSAGINFSVSPKSAKFLQDYSDKKIPSAFNAMRLHHQSKFPEDKIEEWSTYLTGTIREQGALHYVTYGNCACLGTMPKVLGKNEGYCLDSHNVDTSWQQLNLVAGLASTWKWVRDSLRYT